MGIGSSLLSGLLLIVILGIVLLHGIENPDTENPAQDLLGFTVSASSAYGPAITGLGMDIPGAVPSGSYLRIIDNMRNQGSEESGAIRVTYSLEPVSGEKKIIILDSATIENLLPGEQKNLNISVPVALQVNPGTYQVIRDITFDDPAGGDGNQIRQRTGNYIEIAPSLGNELIGDNKESITEVEPGETITITSDIRNTNATASVLTRLSFYLCKSGDLTDNPINIGNSSEIFLSPGESRQVTSFLSVPPDLQQDTYYFISSFMPAETLIDQINAGIYWFSATPVKVIAGPVQESDITTLQKSPSQPPDTNPDITTVKTSYPDEIYIGDSFEITDSLQNIGGTTASIVRVEYFLSTKEDGSNGRHLGWSTFHNVKAGEIPSTREVLGAPDNIIPGIYYLSKKIVVTSNPQETNTGNNFWTGNRPMRVLYDPSAPIADVTHVRTEFPCGDPGDTVEISDTVTNVGNACAKGVSVAYYLSPYESFDPATSQYLGVWKINQICPGEQNTHVISVTIPDDLPDGNYYWYSVIDPCSFMSYCGEGIMELDKSNNVNIGRLTIGPCVFCSC